MALSHSPRIVTDGLSLLFDPANSKSYPGTGNIIYDLSGNGNHGTLVGSPVFSNGHIIYDGTDDQINVASNQTSLNFSEEQTIMIWMNHTFTSGRKNPYNQAYGGYGTWTHEQGDFMRIYFGDAGSNTIPYINADSESTPRSTWTMLTTTRNTSEVKWYFNNLNTRTTSHSYSDLTATTAQIQFGNGYAGRWVGSMGPMILYKRALSETEVQQNFNALRGRYGM